jgi:hypothetical protein
VRASRVANARTGRDTDAKTENPAQAESFTHSLRIRRSRRIARSRGSASRISGRDTRSGGIARRNSQAKDSKGVCLPITLSRAFAHAKAEKTFPFPPHIHRHPGDPRSRKTDSRGKTKGRKKARRRSRHSRAGGIARRKSHRAPRLTAEGKLQSRSRSRRAGGEENPGPETDRGAHASPA